MTPSPRPLRRLTGLIALSVVAAAAVPVAASAWGDQRHRYTPIECGAVITDDAVLYQDLHCDEGIIVATSGVRLNLRGHELSGTSGTGIEIQTDNARPVQITWGTVSGFDRGIDAVGSSVNLTGVHLEGSTSRGLNVNGHDSPGGKVRASVLASTFSDNAQGISAAQTVNVDLTVRASRFDNNGVGAVWNGAGLHTSITGSHFSGNETGIVSFQSDGHRIEHNTFTGNEQPARLIQSRHNRFAHNRVISNTDGLFIGSLQAQGNQVVGNFFIGNGSYGAQIGDGFGDVSGTVVDSNVFVSNGAAGLWFDGRMVADGSTINNNLAIANGNSPGGHLGRSGFLLDDGLHIDVPPGAGDVTVAGNLLIANAGHGIESYGAIDGGNNTSIANGIDASFGADPSEGSPSDSTETATSAATAESEPPATDERSAAADLDTGSDGPASAETDDRGEIPEPDDDATANDGGAPPTEGPVDDGTPDDTTEVTNGPYEIHPASSTDTGADQPVPPVEPSG